MFKTEEIKAAKSMKSAVAMMRENLQDDQWAKRALIAIYNNQTAEEQSAGETKEDNGIGFTGVDAGILTSFAEFYLANKFLSPKQMTILKNKIGKYSGQLIKIANLR